MRWTSTLAALGLLLSSAGCGWWLQSDYPDRRQALLDCEREHGRGSQRCADLRDRADAESDAYAEEARRAWGCDTAHPGERCPIER